MTISFKQTAQVTGVTAFQNITNTGRGDAYVFNPSLPAIIFEYYSGSTLNVGVVIGTSTQNNVSSILNVSSPGLYASSLPQLWFLNAILVGGSAQSSSDWYPFYCVYNLSNNNFNCAYNIQPSLPSPTEFYDLALDFNNQVAYLYIGNANTGQAYIFSISFSNLSTLIGNLQFPSSYQVAFIQPASPPSSFNVHGGRFLYYNGTFYFNGHDGSYNVYIWSVPYSSISWSSSVPSSAQSAGSLYKVWTGNGTIEFPFGNLFLNYIVSGSSLTAEILIYAVANFTSSNYYTSMAIISFNPNNNNATVLYSLTSANVPGTAVNMGGIIVFAQFVSGSSGAWNIAVSAYDRNLGVYQQSSVFSNVLDLKVAQPGYAIVLNSGSSSSGTVNVTVYQILVDTTPIIQNLTYNNGSLSGTVVDQTSGNPLANITVFLIQLASEGDDWASGTVIASTTTNTSGGFSFNITQAGYYAVYAVP